MKRSVRPGGRSARVRKDVLAATLAVLQEQGFAGLTFESVATRAGVHRTTLHRRWSTRAELVADAMLEVSATQVPVPDTGRLRSDLGRFALEVRDAMATPVSRAIATALAASGDAQELKDVARRFWTTRFAATRQVVERAVERGELPERTDPRLIVEALVGPIWFRTFVVGERADNGFVDRLVDLVIAGVGGEST